MAIGNPINLTSNVEGKNISVIATAGQTQFTVTGGYRINQISVFRNGVRLVDGRDYTALDGSIITLLSAATVADVIEFQVFDDFRVSDALNVNSGGNVNGNVTVTGILSTSNLSIGSSISLDATSGIITAVQVIAGNITGTAATATNAEGLIGTPDITINNLVGVGATFTGVVTYEDVTNVDSIGIVTARTGLEVTANGLVVNAGVSTFAADLSIADKIIHTGDTNTAIRFPSADTFTVETSGVERLRVGSTGTVGVAGLSTATSFGAFNHLSAPFGGGTVTYTVTVASKTANHRYNGTGSSNGYLIDGVEAPFLTLTPGRTYRFTNDNTGSHPLKFYLEADKTTLYTTGVTFDNSYTEIVVSDSTPTILHYQCTNHGYMGNSVQVNSNISGGLVGTPDVAVTNINAGIATFTGAISATTGDFVDIDVDGQTELDDLNVAGVSTFVGNVNLQANLDLQDNDKILLGTGDDIEIFHNGTSGRITNSDGSFFIGGSRVKLTNAAISEVFVDCIENGRVDIFYDASVKLTTKTDGVDITGELQCDSLDVDGNSSLSGDVDLIGDSYSAVWDKSEDRLKFNDNAKAVFGTGLDLEIYHDGSNSIINDGGTGNLQLQAAGTTRIEVTTSGATVTGTLNATTAVTQMELHLPLLVKQLQWHLYLVDYK